MGLNELLARRRLLVAPGVFDGISARLAQRIGFEAVYIGSSATSASMLGQTDMGFLGLSDMVDQVRRIAAVIDLPIIVDAEDGFGNAINVRHSVRELERAGAAAAHIEDHEFGKHLVPGPTVLPLDVAADKIKAAVDGRKDSAFKIIARTDSMNRYGLDAAIERCNAYAGAGADLAFIPGLPTEKIASVGAKIPIPLVNTDPFHQPSTTIAELEATGLKIVLYFGLSNFLAYKAVEKGFKALKEGGNLAALFDTTPDYVGDFDELLDITQVRELAVRYHLLESPVQSPAESRAR